MRNRMVLVLVLAGFLTTGCQKDSGDPECTPQNCLEIGKECGSWDDGCGDPLVCGQCGDQEVCSTSGQCCQRSCNWRCAGSDGCGGVCTPSDCSAGTVCDPDSGSCRTECTPKDCQALAKQCGTWSDGCGNPLECPECPQGSFCGETGLCTPEPCEPLDCAGLDAQCGSWDDGCWGIAECGECPEQYESCNDMGRCAKPWTYIRMIGYDSLWGDSGPSMQELIDWHVDYDLAMVQNKEQINLVLFGDAYGDTGGVYFYVGPDGPERIDIPEPDTGDVQTYQDFIDWVVENHPGQRYAVSYWSHGSGAVKSSKSIGFDDTNGDQLDPVETGEVFAYLKRVSKSPVDVFFLCACLTQMFENVYELQGLVDYVVAGESVVGCYDDVLVAIDENPDADARTIADLNCAGQQAPYENDVVYSSVDVSQVSQAAGLLDQLATLLTSYATASTANRQQLRQVVSSVQSMNYMPSYPMYPDAYLDIVHLAEKLESLGDAAISQKAQELADFFQNSLITSCMLQNNYEGLYKDAHGISIFHPNDNYSSYHDTYADLNFALDTGWDEYLQEIY